jgi:hypothetical protein
MKNRIKCLNHPKNERLITTFGSGRLVRLADGSTLLRGGQPHDQTAAKEWISLFMHDLVLSGVRKS